MKNEDQIAAEVADKLSRPPRCSCAGSQFSESGKRERSKRKAIIKAAIEKAYELGRQDDQILSRAAHASESENVHIEHYFPKGYNPDDEPFKTIIANYRKSRR